MDRTTTGRRRGGAIERARQDVAEGHAWRAVRRLQDRLRNVGLDDATLRALADAHLAMGNEGAAGSWLMLSGAEGDQVEQAVQRWVAGFRGDAHAALEATPLVERTRVAELSVVARARLERLGCRLPADPSLTPLGRPLHHRSRLQRVQELGCILIFFASAAIVGLGLLAWAALGIRGLWRWISS